MSLSVARKKSTHHDNPVAKAFGQRVNQIRIRKNITIRDLAEKSGLTKGIIEATVKGSRYPEKSEEKIKLAVALGLTAEQLIGVDTKDIKDQLDAIIRCKQGFDQALALVAEMQERCVCLNDELDVLYYKGRILRGTGHKEKAHQIVNQAYSLASENLDTSDPRFIRACNELVQFYFYSNEIEAGISFVNDVEQKRYFEGDTFQQATLAHYKGTFASMQGNLDAAEESYRIAQTLYTIDGRAIEAGQVESSLGTILYLQHKIEDALAYFEKAIAHLANDVVYNRCVVSKEYSRALIAAGQIEKAVDVITKTISTIRMQNLNFTALEGKLLLMLGDISNSVEPLEQILHFENLQDEILINVHDVLSQNYALLQDTEKTRHHHSICVHLLSWYSKKYLPYREGDWF